MTEAGRVVHKFGGTSLADAGCFRRVARIIAAWPEPRQVIVVSAMGGTTDTLVHAVELAASRDDSYRDVLEGVCARHSDTIRELLPPEAAGPVIAAIDRDMGDIHDVLRASMLLRGFSRDTMELVTGYGEVWSAQILAGLLSTLGVDTEWLDAREVLTVQRSSGGDVDVDWAASRERVSEWTNRHRTAPTLVITGFIASTEDGVAATLGRNGSDFSASIFAALLDASGIHIWTDVDGVMSANPSLV